MQEANSERITPGKTDSISSGENGKDANVSLGDSINAITRHIGTVTFKKIESDLIDPFKVAMQAEIGEIKEMVRQNGEKFDANVVEAVKKAKRHIVEDRLSQFNIESLVQKLTDIPDLIASQQTTLSVKSNQVSKAEDNYKAELTNISTAAGQQGMVGENAADRENILKLIEDRIINKHAHGTLIDLTFQSTGRSKATLECSDLDISTGRELYFKWKTLEREHEDEKIALEKLRNQFSALKSISSLIVSTVG